MQPGDEQTKMQSEKISFSGQKRSIQKQLAMRKQKDEDGDGDCGNQIRWLTQPWDSNPILNGRDRTYPQGTYQFPIKVSLND